MENDSKEKLLHAAIRLFAKHGYDGISIRRIADEAGVNSSLISYHFQGKEGLYRAAIEKQMRFIFGFIEDADAKHLTPREILRTYARTMLQIHQASPFFAQILCRELLEPSAFFQEITREKIKPMFALLRRALEEGIRRGEFRGDLDLAQTVLMLAGSVNFYFLTRPVNLRLMRQHDDFALDYVEQTLQIFLAGIERRDDTNETA